MEAASFHDLNPGNGTETAISGGTTNPGLGAFHDLNPGNGTETHDHPSDHKDLGNLSTTLIPATGLKQLLFHSFALTSDFPRP